MEAFAAETGAFTTDDFHDSLQTMGETTVVNVAASAPYNDTETYIDSVESESESSESSYSFADKGGQCGGGDDIGDSNAGVTNTRNLQMTENPMTQSSLEGGAPQFAMTDTRQETTMEEYDTGRWEPDDSQEEIHY